MLNTSRVFSINPTFILDLAFMYYIIYVFFVCGYRVVIVTQDL